MSFLGFISTVVHFCFIKVYLCKERKNLIIAEGDVLLLFSHYHQLNTIIASMSQGQDG